MLREGLERLYVKNTEFRNRGETPGRLENFHDAIFALSITLLLISSEPPTHFNQIKHFVYDLIPFALCIALIVMTWQGHFLFFYRYGFQKGKILFLNTLFLFMVLFYVYPLKFLTRLIELPIAYFISDDELWNEVSKTISFADIDNLMVIYGIGASSVFLVLALMYRYAMKHADDLNLNEIERFETRVSIQSNLVLGSIPILSAILALSLTGWQAGMFSGFAYFLYTPLILIFRSRVDKNREKLLSTLNQEGN